MHHMIAATTAAIGCSRATDVQTVTIQPLPTVPATASADPTPPPPPPRPSASATVAAPSPPPAPPNPSGYLVVDMLPAPARCMGVAGATKAHGIFQRGHGGMVLELVVTLPKHGALAGVHFNGTASAWSAKIVSKTVRNGSAVAVVVVKPSTPGASSLGVTLGVDCGPRGTGSLAVTATFPSSPMHGTIPQLSMQDY